MKQNSTTLEAIKEKAIPILKHAAVKKAALFGSYVRGDQHEKSDIDILVDLPDNATLIDLVGLQQDLEEKLGKHVDVVSYNGIHSLLKDSILQHQYPII